MGYKSQQNIRQKGYVMLFLILVVTLFFSVIGAFFSSLVVSEIKIAASQKVGSSTYYLSSAGVNEVLSKVQYDPVWKANFENGTMSAANSTINRSNVFNQNDGYTVEAKSLSPGTAQVFATGTVAVGNATAQRVVRVSFSRALNATSSWTYAVSAAGDDDNDLEVKNVSLTVNNGSLQSNNDIVVKASANVVVENGDVRATDDIEVQSSSSLTVNNGQQTENAPSESMPSVDFNSSDANSFLSRAQAGGTVYTDSQFESLASGTVLTGVIYVTGDVRWRNKDLTVNGILVVDGDLDMKNNQGNTITVNETPLVEGSGIFTTGELEIEKGNLYVTGVVYSLDEVELDTGSNKTIVVTGALIGREVELEGAGSGTITINYDASSINAALNLASDSPVVQIDYWEEQY